MQKLVFINGSGNEIDLTSGNFGITNWEGLSNVPLNIQTQQVPFEDGGVFLEALMDQREIAVTVAIYDGNNLELRYQKKRELISALNPKLGEGTLIYTNDYLSRQIKAVPQIPLFENKNSNDAGTLKASVAFSCPSPYWEDVEDTEVTFTDGETITINNMGDVPTQPKIKISGQIVNPSIVNETTSKRINVEKEILSSIEIETGFGKKSIVENKFNLFVKEYGARIKDFIYIKKYDRYIFTTGESVIIYDVKSNAKKFVSDNYSGLLFNINAVAYSDNIDLIIVAGEQGKGLYSYNGGDTWGVLSTLRSSYDINSITYCSKSKKFCAVGNHGTIKYQDEASATTSNWTEKSTTVTENLNSVCVTLEGSYQSEYIFIVGNGGTMIRLEGTQVSIYYIPSPTTENLKKVANVDNIAIAVGESGIIAILSTNSANLINSGTTENLNSVCYNGNEAIIVGDNGLVLGMDLYGEWSCSPIVSAITDDIFIINYDNNTAEFILACTEKIIKTQNFEDIEIILKGVSENINKVTKTPDNKLYGVGNSGLIFKIEGDVLTKINSGTTNNLRGICYSEEKNKFVIVGDNIIMTSSDGNNWQSIVTSYYMRDVIYVDYLSTFIAVGQDTIINSEDAITWNVTYSSESDVVFNTIDYSEEQEYIFVSGAMAMAGSSNGIDWTIQGFTLGTVTHGAVYDPLSKYFYFTYEYRGMDNSVRRLRNNVVDYNGICRFSGSELQTCIVFKGKNFFVGSENGKLYFVTDYHKCFNLTGISGIYLYSAVVYNDKVLFFGTGGFIGEIRTDEIENIINYLSTSSDMDFSLDVGTNNIKIVRESGKAECTITYRQKYIGV